MLSYQPTGIIFLSDFTKHTFFISPIHDNYHSLKTHCGGIIHINIILISMNTIKCSFNIIIRIKERGSSVMISKNNILIVDFQPECPLLPPSPAHICVPPVGTQDCHYTTDHCCCDNCPDSFTLSCVPDSITGAGFWQSTLCPAEGCGSEGEWR